MADTNLSSEDVAKVLDELAECVLTCRPVPPDLFLRAAEAELFLIASRDIEGLEVLRKVTFRLSVEEARSSTRFHAAKALFERTRPIDSIADSAALRVLAARIRER